MKWIRSFNKLQVYNSKLQMDPTKKQSMTTAISHLFNPKPQSPPQSQITQILIWYGHRKILGSISYQKQKRFIVRKDTKISQFRDWIINKIKTEEPTQRQNVSYQLIHRNKLLVGHGDMRIGDLVAEDGGKGVGKDGDQENFGRIQVSVIGVDTF